MGKKGRKKKKQAPPPKEDARTLRANRRRSNRLASQSTPRNQEALDRALAESLDEEEKVAAQINRSRDKKEATKTPPGSPDPEMKKISKGDLDSLIEDRVKQALASLDEDRHGGSGEGGSVERRPRKLKLERQRDRRKQARESA